MVSKWERWLFPAWVLSSVAWTIGILVTFPIQFREDMFAVLALVLVPCGLWYILLFAIGWRLDKHLDTD